jgi:hypothetical protein
MARAHSEVQTSQTGSGQDITYSKLNLDAAWAALYPEQENAYDGTGALTISQMVELWDTPRTTLRDRIIKAIKRGTMVKVAVRNIGDGKEYIDAYVPVAQYNEWKQGKG